MSNNFRAVQDALIKNPNAPTNWHLLTLTFDPEFDTPDKLKNYATSYGCNPQHWSFLTGALIDVTALGEQFGLTFWRDPADRHQPQPAHGNRGRAGARAKDYHREQMDAGGIGRGNRKGGTGGKIARTKRISGQRLQ